MILLLALPASLLERAVLLPSADADLLVVGSRRGVAYRARCSTVVVREAASAS